jgi:hypothetical protein
MNLKLEEILPLVKHEVKFGPLFKDETVPFLLQQDEPESGHVVDLRFPSRPVKIWHSAGTHLEVAEESALDRVNVRRLLLEIRKAISDAASYTLFEFNDAWTRTQFKNMVQPYLDHVQKCGGIENFLVVCDETNNPPEIVDTNRFVGDIYVQPTKNITYIKLNFVATRTGVSFDEITNKF